MQTQQIKEKYSIAADDFDQFGKGCINPCLIAGLIFLGSVIVYGRIDRHLREGALHEQVETCKRDLEASLSRGSSGGIQACVSLNTNSVVDKVSMPSDLPKNSSNAWNTYYNNLNINGVLYK